MCLLDMGSMTIGHVAFKTLAVCLSRWAPFTPTQLAQCELDIAALEAKKARLEAAGGKGWAESRDCATLCTLHHWHRFGGVRVIAIVHIHLTAVYCR